MTAAATIGLPNLCCRRRSWLMVGSVALRTSGGQAATVSDTAKGGRGRRSPNFHCCCCCRRFLRHRGRAHIGGARPSSVDVHFYGLSRPSGVPVAASASSLLTAMVGAAATASHRLHFDIPVAATTSNRHSCGWAAAGASPTTPLEGGNAAAHLASLPAVRVRAARALAAAADANDYHKSAGASAVGIGAARPRGGSDSMPLRWRPPVGP